MTRDLSILLQGITGSTAYGLATPTSDIDRHGIFLAPTRAILGVVPVQESVVTTDPDVALHEVGKFVRLAMKANPTILELLWLESYEILNPAAQLLIDNRDAFLSKTIYKSYGGYAIHQARRLNARGDNYSSDTKNRTAKHSRHCLRLIQQGSQLLKTGTMSIKVENRDDLFAFGELPVAEIVDRFEREFKAFEAIQTHLPDHPDVDRINRLLLEIREAYG